MQLPEDLTRDKKIKRIIEPFFCVCGVFVGGGGVGRGKREEGEYKDHEILTLLISGYRNISSRWT